MAQKRSKDNQKGSVAIKYDFSNIQWQGAELDKLKGYLIEQIDLISQYPEREAETLVRLLSRRLELTEKELIVTDGATGAIHLVAGQYSGSVSLLLPPTNNEFYHALERTGHTIKLQEEIKELSKLNLEGVDMLWLSNPNNPDGRFFSRRSLLTLLRENPNLTVVLDISLTNFVVEDNIRPVDIKKYPNLILVSSFSHAYNIPGLRVGYLIANADKIASFRTKYYPNGINTLALEACRYVLLHPAQFTIPVRKWLRNSLELADALDKLDGVSVLYGATPFFVLRLEEVKAADLAKYLLEKHGIKVGTSESDIDLKDNEIRISGFASERINELLIEAVSEFLSTLPSNQ